MNNDAPLIEQQNDIPTTSRFTGAGRQRNGKVARLPKDFRDRLNNLLRDGKPYAEIIASLGPECAELNEDNISNWKNGGYQDWLRDQEQVAAFQAKAEFALDLVRGRDITKIHQATLQIAAANLCQLLIDLDPVTLRELIQKEPDKYTRLLNSVARLSDGQIKAERFASQEAERQAKLVKAKNPEPGGISEEALKAAEARLKLL